MPPHLFLSRPTKPTIPRARLNGGSGESSGERQPPTTRVPPPPTPPPRAQKPPPRERHTSWLRRGAADAPGSPFHELGLAGAASVPAGRAPKRRNYAVFSAETPTPPLVQPPPTPPAPPATTTAQDVFLDVGCGSGRFLLLLARRLSQMDQREEQAAGDLPMMRLLLQQRRQQRQSDAPPSRSAPPHPLLLIGLEAQPALVTRANAWAAYLEEQEEQEEQEEHQRAPPPLIRCRFVAGDAAQLLLPSSGEAGSNSLDALLHQPTSTTTTNIIGASIHFPDPVLAAPPPTARAPAASAPPQQQQRLRRCPALDLSFAKLLASRLAPGAPLLVQSECRATAEALVEGALLASGCWEAAAPPVRATTPLEAAADSPPPPPQPWWCWTFNPLGVPTEREVYLEERARCGEEHSIWRALLLVRRGGE